MADYSYGWSPNSMRRRGFHPTHVKFPHFGNDRAVVELEDGSLTEISRWQLIYEELVDLREQTLKRMYGETLQNYDDTDETSTFMIVKNCILTYHPTINCNFRILEEFYQEGDFEVCGDGTRLNLDYVTAFIAEAALALPELFQAPLELLNGKWDCQRMELSKDQLCCLLANAFLCTFPGREVDPNGLNSLPRINFTALFDDKDNHGPGWKSRLRHAKLEKLKCFLSYFSRMSERFRKSMDSPLVTFERRSMPPHIRLPDWENVNEAFRNLSVYTQGKIEDSIGSLQVEFANKFVGGGTLGSGAAMEEILFSCCPELVASQLFTSVLGDLDVLLVHKYEQFSSHKGYGSSFQFDGNFYDDHVNVNHVVALDAYHFPRDSTQLQFEKRWVDRELNKCVVAFYSPSAPQTRQGDCINIASGKWGCGVFNGHPLLKCIIQWMAASYCHKSLDLYTFGDVQLSNDLNQLKQFLLSREDITVGKLYSILLTYEGSPDQSDSLLHFIQKSFPSRKRWRVPLPAMFWKVFALIGAIFTYLYWILPSKVYSNVQIGFKKIFRKLF